MKGNPAVVGGLWARWVGSGVGVCIAARFCMLADPAATRSRPSDSTGASPAGHDLSTRSDQATGRIRGNTMARCADDASPRRTQPIRQRRRTDIRAAPPFRDHHAVRELSENSGGCRDRKQAFAKAVGA